MALLGGPWRWLEFSVGGFRPETTVPKVKTVVPMMVTNFMMMGGCCTNDGV